MGGEDLALGGLGVDLPANVRLGLPRGAGMGRWWDEVGSPRALLPGCLKSQGLGPPACPSVCPPAWGEPVPNPELAVSGSAWPWGKVYPAVSPTGEKQPRVVRERENWEMQKE